MSAGQVSCIEANDCPGAWTCDIISETCVKTEPADFYWMFIIASIIAAAFSGFLVVALTELPKLKK